MSSQHVLIYVVRQNSKVHPHNQTNTPRNMQDIPRFFDKHFSSARYHLARFCNFFFAGFAQKLPWESYVFLCYDFLSRASFNLIKLVSMANHLWSFIVFCHLSLLQSFIPLVSMENTFLTTFLFIHLGCSFQNMCLTSQ